MKYIKKHYKENDLSNIRILLNYIKEIYIKKPIILKNNLEYVSSIICTGLISPYTAIIQKSIQCIRELSIILKDKFTVSNWMYFEVLLLNLQTSMNFITDSCLDLINEMHETLVPSYLINSLYLITKRTSNPEYKTHYLMCLFDLLIDYNENIVMFCPNFLKIILMMKDNYEPLTMYYLYI